MIRAASRTGLLVLCASVACSHSTGIDPNEGALHLNDLGQSNAYGSNPEARSTVGSDSVVRVPDRFAGFDSAVRTRWVHRGIHEAEGVDVDAVMDLLVSESAAARTKADQRRAIRRATCRLGDGNLQLVEPTAKMHSRSGLDVRAVGRSLLVQESDGRYGDAVEPGDRVVAVDGQETVAWLDHTCVGPGSTAGHRMARLAEALERGQSSREQRRPRKLTVHKADSGRTREVTLDWKPEQTETCVEGKAFTDDVGVVTVRRLDCAEATFDAQLTAAAQAAGTTDVLLDLRRVVGDDERNAQVLARRFSPTATVWATKRPAASGGFSDVPLPEAGPAMQASRRWLLISPRCDATCELAAAVVSGDAGVTTVGKPSAGSVAETTAVSVGPTSSVTVPIVQFALPGSATPLEGRGVTPDIEVTPTVDVLARGHDPELVAVARRIRGAE